MNILLTGSNGFLGSYFKDNYNRKYNINTFSFLNDNFQALDLKSINTIIHLSALVHKMGGASEDEYERVNLTQTIELAKKAKEAGVKHFIFMSTIKVYGEENSITYTESSECNPQDDYAKSKLKAEQELLKLEGNDFKISMIRTPIVYGYGVKANIKNLINLVSKVPILPFGNIQNRRSMVYVGNLCHLVDVLIRFPIKLRMMEDMTSNIFLACDDKIISTTKFIELIADALEKKIYLVKVPFFDRLLSVFKPSFFKRLYGSLEVDNKKTKQMLNYENLYSVEDGIRYMIHGENK